MVGIFLSISDMIKSGGASMCDAGITVYNGCIKTLYGILLANPAGSSPSATPTDVSQKLANVWQGLIGGTAYDILLTIAGAFTITFFVIGFCKDSVDIKKVGDIENIISMFIRLILSVACVTLVGKWLPYATSAGIGVCTKIFGKPDMTGITMNGNDMLSGIDNSIVSLIFGLIFMIVMIACGAGILFVGLIRLCKLILYACLAPVMLSTISGGSGINRTAGLWIRNFLAVVFSNVVILLAMFISSGLIGMKILEDGSNSILVAIVTIAEVVVVVAFIKTADTILERFFGATG